MAAYASADAAQLEKLQRLAEVMLGIFARGSIKPSYARLASFMHEKLLEKFTDREYGAFRTQVEERFGSMGERKFAGYERYDQGDRLIYLAGFTKERIVVISFGFTKDGRLTDFLLNPYQGPIKENKR